MNLNRTDGARALPDVWVHRRPAGVSYGPLVERAGMLAVPRAVDPWLHVLLVLTRNEFRARYRAQALGVLWSLLSPLVMMGILTLVFTRVFRTGVPHFPVFLLIGMALWEWLASGLQAATSVFVVHADLVKRTVFPRHLLPIATMLSFGINFLMEALIVAAMVVVFPSAYRLSPALLVVPVVLLFLVLLLTGLVMATSVLNIIYRDVAYLVTTSLTLLYWLTPIIYPLEAVPQPWQTLLRMNPLASMLVALRGAVMLGQWPSPLTWVGMVVPSLLVLAIGRVIFRHYEHLALDFV